MADFQPLNAALTGKNFVNGIILYTGAEVVAFGENLFAVPIAALWQW